MIGGNIDGYIVILQQMFNESSCLPIDETFPTVCFGTRTGPPSWYIRLPSLWSIEAVTLDKMLREVHCSAKRRCRFASWKCASVVSRECHRVLVCDVILPCGWGWEKYIRITAWKGTSLRSVRMAVQMVFRPFCFCREDLVQPSDVHLTDFSE